MTNARLRFAALWLSQTARVLADWCLRIFVVRLVAQDPQRQDYAWHLATALFVGPFVLLGPFNGAVSNSLPKRWVLVGAAAWCLGVTLLFGALGDGWLVGGFLVAVGTAVFSPTRYALLPAAAQDTHLPLSRVTGWIELGSAAAIVAGVALGYTLFDPAEGRFPAPVLASAGLSLFALLAALPVHFPSDVCRPEPVGRAVADFFQDGRRVWNDRQARGSMLGLASLFALLAAGSGAVVARVLGDGVTARYHDLLPALTFVGFGTAAGALLASAQGHPTRSLGLVPFATTGLLACLAWVMVSGGSEWACFFLGLMGGLANVPLRTAYQAALPADARGNGMAVSNTANFTLTTFLALLLLVLSQAGALPSPLAQLVFLAILAAAGALAAWKMLYREALEQLIEIFLWPFYRIKGYGPGLEQFPRRGPVMILANHAAWFDPLWLGKMLPRRVTPMMTSVFYDIPVLRWFMVNVVRAIRVEASQYRREAPELQDALAVLDRGECLMIFPEGMMRRSEERPLRQFAQGVGLLLQQRPETPVVACWIEGNWGSYLSYFHGPPAKNKRMDRWRPIDIGVSAPQVLPAELLADLRATRRYLMQACLEARRHLGLEPLSLAGPAMEEAEESIEMDPPPYNEDDKRAGSSAPT